MSDQQVIEAAKKHFGSVLEQQLDRVERLRQEGDRADYATIHPIVIGIIGGDGIGPSITAASHRVLQQLLIDQETEGKIRFNMI